QHGKSILDFDSDLCELGSLSSPFILLELRGFIFFLGLGSSGGGGG
nr:hypothetical protein [Tanacetum cinerariifolium]